MADVLKNYVNGEFLEGDASQVIDVVNPSTEAVIAHVPTGDVALVREAIEHADAAQQTWATLPAIQRGEYLRKIATGIRERAAEITQTIIEEGGKVHALAETEVYFTADYLDYMAEWARRYEGEIIQSDRQGEHIFLYKKPLGVTTGILPWNFPFFLIARKMAPALLTGNTIVIKPSVETPINAQIFAEIVHESGLPKGVFNLINGSGRVLGEELANNDKVALVSLTGSEPAGKQVMASASQTLTKVNLELGGKAPAIVFEDADLDAAVENIVASRVINTGQVCNCAERVYVHENVKAAFTEKLVEKMASVHYSDPNENKDSAMGPLISKKAQANVHRLVQGAVEAGGQLLLGGELPTEKGYYYPPTVIDQCTNEMEIVQEEIFGPVLPLVSFKTFDEVIEKANDTKYGLTSSVYTKDLQTAFKAVERLEFGETYINRENFEAMQGFHAGVKHSGIGGADGKHGLEEYLRTHIVYMQL
ncbi:aldehyde dehydrogenase [Staphylococcus intermedius]|uniref:Glycine betaine aldehyde dehydrogenase gbsA n=1 Tax=Staphylococcus intermedius NCTC 11048 TaxID=1141106 RepID=A0A380G426_STAIN|nr:aldehyde dehydrogenase [Staphylococcus intermedius]PCF63898.1 aldehyde dehydrogenase [Staphylococcus intermedius]PCF78613.1 aldehyde dehydrogenase [Staphylococcus intermedius]PCF79586.1 aldehyde dehydrogenase [Staphylococcus intermedius]PCF86679.1 aldehyde dehydrogenase [Staphylococcus intermedius]PCF89756.1 aldehyde dehydrogenase [Staphylococcus intermedius]